MIAVVGIASETPVRLLMEACASKKIPCTLFNQRRQGDWSVQYDVFRPNASILANGDVTFTPSECSGLYLRTMDHTKLPEWAGTTTDRCRIEDTYSNLWMLLDDETLGTRVVNSPSVQLSNNSKPYSRSSSTSMAWIFLIPASHRTRMWLRTFLRSTRP